MPTLKVRCPECDASVRRVVDPVNEGAEHTLTCPRCDCEFTTTVRQVLPRAGRCR